MVKINIPLYDARDIYVGDGSTKTFTLTHSNPQSIHVFISGIYLTDGIDYIISGQTVTFTETPLLDENINIIYKY